MGGEDLGAGVTLYQGDCLDVLPTLAAGSVDAVVTDPPYFGMKADDWDNQWTTAADFLGWLGGICDQFRRVLKPNGSLYLFASAEMAGRVEAVVADRFRVLNRVCWAKPAYCTKAEMNSKDGQRCYFPRSEYVLFAEQPGVDELADLESGWTEARRAANRQTFGEPIRRAMAAAGVNGREVCEALGLYSKVNHGGVVSNWLSGHNEPTESQWVRLVDYMGRFGCAGLLPMSKPAQPDVPTADEAARRFRELRRPFTADERRPYTDVWEYPTVSTYPGKHPCEKPKRMLRDILLTSTRPGDLILDPFAGSGTAAVAAVLEGRRCVLIEKEPAYCDIIRRRVADASGTGPGSLFHQLTLTGEG